MTGIQENNLPSSRVIEYLIGNFDGNTVQIALGWLATAINALQGPSYETLAGLQADLDWAGGSIATVWGGSDAEQGVYKKLGASGSGSWQRIGELPGVSVTQSALAAKADLSALLERDVSATRVYGTKDMALSGAGSLPAGTDRVMVKEGSALVLRGRNATNDPLFATGDPWGVWLTIDLAAEVAAREAALEALSAALSEGLADSLQKSANLSDLADAGSARAHLGVAGEVAPAIGLIERPSLTGEVARVEFAAGVVSLPGVAGDPARPIGDVAALSDHPTGLLSLVRDGVFEQAAPGALRRARIGDFAGAVIEPAATVYAPDAPVGGAGYTLTGCTVSDSDASPVSGEPWQRLTAVKSGTTARDVRIKGITTEAGRWYQIDAVVRPGATSVVGLRFPFGFTVSGSGALIVAVDLANYDPIQGLRAAEDAAAKSTYSAPVVTPLVGGGYHVRVRAKCVTGATNQYCSLIAKTDFSGNVATSVFDQGDVVFDAALLSVSEIEENAPRLPAHRVGFGVAVPAEIVTLPTTGWISGQAWTVDCTIRPADMAGLDLAQSVWRFGAGDEFVELQSASGGVRVVAVSGGVTATIDLSDRYADVYRVAISHDGATLRAALNGAAGSAAWAVGDLAAALTELRARNYTPPSGAVHFAGLIGHWRLGAAALDAGELCALTLCQRDAALGETAPAIVDEGATAVLSVDGAGRLEFVPGRAAREYIDSGAAYADLVPSDAMAVTPKSDGLHFMSDQWGARTHRYLYSPHSGLTTAYSQTVDLIWGGGQSLMYGNVYDGRIEQPTHPGFVDINDSLDNSVFGQSAVGLADAVDDWKIPVISEREGGPGGAMYPTLHALARIRAEADPAPHPIVGRSIGASGERIAHLWPFGTRDDNGDALPDFEGEMILNHWEHVKKFHAGVAAVATAKGLTVRTPAFVWVQGTADAGIKDYYDRLDLAYADLLNLTAEYHGDSGAPLWVMTQSGAMSDATGWWNVCQDQIQWLDDNTDKSVLATPLYAPDYTLVLKSTGYDTVHPSYESTTLYGEVIAEAIQATLSGESWHIGQPDITISGTVIRFDYSRWLRDDERLIIAEDTYYGGEGVDAGAGFQIGLLDVDRLNQPARYLDPLPVTGLEVSSDGRAYLLTVPEIPSEPYYLSYAYQAFAAQTDLSHYGHRGLCRTDWERPSRLLPGKNMHRWVPSFRKEFV